MKATVDANILFSSLLRKGITRKIWFGPEIELYATEFLLTESKKYSSFLRKKFSGTDEECRLLLQALFSQLSLVKDADLKPFLPAAASLLKDPKDWLYLACALQEDTIIWSNDKHFKEQKRVRAMTTSELVKEIGTL